MTSSISFYETHCGRKATVTMTNKGMIGTVREKNKDGEWFDKVMEWQPNGKRYADGALSDYDLVREWKKPEAPERLLAYIDATGHVRFYNEELSIETNPSFRRAPWLDEPQS